MTARTVVRALLVIAVLLQGVVLYAPSGGGEPPFAGADKVVHLAVFLLPTVLASAAGLPARWAVGVLVGHAVLSELIQAGLLPSRSGDPLDTLADLAGVALGGAATRAARHRQRAVPPAGGVRVPPEPGC